MTSKSALRVAALAMLLVPVPASAHIGVGQAGSLIRGFSHPVSGLDHILAMVLVGVFAFQLGGRALWLLPATFVLVMAAGGALGALGIDVPIIEVGIAFSVVLLGAIVAVNIKAPVTVAVGLVGLFAIFHGHAHGAELPAEAVGIAYAFGFMMATALLHAAGIGVGVLVSRLGESRGPAVVRLTGAFSVVAGLAFLTGIL